MINQVLKVLILEDNQYDAELNIKTLHKESWIVDSRVASDEKSFRSLVLEFDPDIILSDYNLPRFNGIDALRISIEKKPLTPFIIVTGSLDEETAVDCIKQGAWDYVLKEHLIRLNPAVKNAIKLQEERKHRKAAETSQTESEEHFRALTQNSPDIIMRFDKNLRHLFVNDAVFEQLNLKPEVFINKTHHEMGIFDEVMCDFWESSIKAVFESHKPNEVEFTLKTLSGLKYIEWRLFPEYSPTGEVLNVLAVARDITFKKDVQETLRINQERLQFALEATSDGLWDWNMKTNEIYFSSRYFTMLGYQAGEFRNEVNVFAKLMHPEDVKRVEKYINELVNKRRESIEMEMRLLRKDGSYAWILSRGKVFSTDENGNPERIVGTNVDMTLRKRQNDIQKTIFDIGNAVVTTRNLDELFLRIQEILDGIIDTKNFFIALYDKTKDMITIPFHRDEKDHFEEFPPGKTCTAYVLRSGVPQLINKEKEKELVDSGEIELFGAESVSWLGVPLKIDNEIIGVFTVQSYDEAIQYTGDDVKILEFVSDQIALAISRKKDEDSIRESEQKQRRIIESSPDGLLVIGNNGVIIDHNSSVLEMLRIRKNKLRQRNFLDFVYPADLKRVEGIFAETIRSGFQKNNQLQMFREDGSKFYAEISLGLIQNSGNAAESFVIIIKDITERINYETNLKVAKERAEESDRLKSSFLSNMSHEIRTPMNAIVGFAELLSQSNVDEEDRREFISHINQGTETLLNLIDDIIDISKIEAGQIRINNSAFRLSSLLSELHVFFKKNLKRQNRENLMVSIFNNGFNSEINIINDSFRLKQVFINLISNAIKFTEKGEVKFGIKHMDAKSITFYVKDTGMGIQKEKQLLIFDRFRQGHESKTKFYGGTGLGLAISKHLVELMGGEIFVESESGIGSEFIFSIGYLNSEAEIKPAGMKLIRTAPNWQNKTILIAEDETSNYLVLSHMLDDTKAKLIWAKDGQEVVDLFKKNPEIDLILMDIQLPIMNGYQATSEIKKIRKDIPIIAQTAYAMSGEKETSLKSGCDDYISKPIKPKDLILIISRHLNSD
jgi:two-component system sensor histidine kinase/response regulator